MELPVEYPQTSPPAIASYNYADLVSQVGILTLYGYILTDSAGESAVLSTQAMTWIGETINKTSMPKTFKTSAFTRKQIVDGKMRVFAYVSVGAGTRPVLRVKAQHYDGTTATDISSEVTDTTGPTMGAGNYWCGVDLAISNVVFNKGDVLQLIIYTETDLTVGVAVIKAEVPLKIDL